MNVLREFGPRIDAVHVGQMAMVDVFVRHIRAEFQQLPFRTNRRQRQFGQKFFRFRGEIIINFQYSRTFNDVFDRFTSHCDVDARILAAENDTIHAGQAVGVFGRCRWHDGDFSVAIWHDIVQQEFHATFQNRIVITQEINILREAVVFHDMLRHPQAAQREVAPPRLAAGQ